MSKLYYKFIGVILVISIIFGYGFIYIRNEEESTIFLSILVYVGIMIFIGILFILMIRRVLVKEWENRCRFLDNVISNRENANYDLCKETLFSKEQMKIKELVRILDNERCIYEKEKESIQSLVTDLSHQIKTPLANISMYNSTLLDRELPRDKQVEFLTYTNTQISKLQWLMDGLIKISRLETDIIALNKDYFKVEDTLALAIGGIYGKALMKNIDVEIKCNPNFVCFHDKKWTGEALFNILENAVKYTADNGKIKILVEKWESFTKIEIKDNGVGIEESEINNIFKRFYRGRNVAQKEGVGIGLFLAREIIHKQGGYITVKSKVNKGSSFTVFLLNKE